jgi:hypothetical protein
MDNFLRLTDDNQKGQSRKVKIPINRNVTPERIEKLKKTFQPFWMRGMIPHSKGLEENPNGRDDINHV